MIQVNLHKEEDLKILCILNNIFQIKEIMILIMIDSHIIHQEEIFKEGIMIIMIYMIEVD